MQVNNNLPPIEQSAAFKEKFRKAKAELKRRHQAIVNNNKSEMAEEGVRNKCSE